MITKEMFRMHSQYLDRLSAEERMSLCKKTADFWKQVFKTGMTPDGVSVIAKPLNTIEMTQG